MDGSARQVAGPSLSMRESSATLQGPPDEAEERRALEESIMTLRKLDAENQEDLSRLGEQFVIEDQHDSTLSETYIEVTQALIADLDRDEGSLDLIRGDLASIKARLRERNESLKTQIAHLQDLRAKMEKALKAASEDLAAATDEKKKNEARLSTQKGRFELLSKTLKDLRAREVKAEEEYKSRRSEYVIDDW